MRKRKLLTNTFMLGLRGQNTGLLKMYRQRETMQPQKPQIVAVKAIRVHLIQ